ncbi:DHA2 family efflux MFS transporter permease subunit [Azoarcus indigens]|nr:DHA2 family efflux MFS transporter permease subunit [Azoarcus indigens]NMG66177.1 DHA2 family efflux MFS transporter permease subunit [Azoarcus indigens]
MSSPIRDLTRDLFRALPAETHTQRHGGRYKWMVLIVASLGTIAGVLSTTSFNVAVPALMRDFALGQEQVQWAITGFMAAMTVGMLPTPWLLDRFGFRRLFLGAVLMMLLASVAGALATHFPYLVFTRVVQGLAAGMLQPLGPLVVMRSFPPGVQGRASGALSFSLVLAPAVAPALGGVLLDRYGWPAIFLLNLPFCVLAVGSALYLLPRAEAAPRHGFDWWGLALLTAGTLALIESVASLQHSGLLAPWTLAQLALAAGLLACFVRHAQRVKKPLISLGLFRHRSFAMGTTVAFAYGFGLYASTYLIPVFLQNALGFGAAAAGMVLVPAGLALAATIPPAGRLADKVSPQWITVAGLACFGLSFLLFALLAKGIGHGELIFVTVLGRVGLGMIMPALNLATLRHLEPHQLSQSSAVISYARQLGGMLGIAVAAVFVAWRESVYGTVVPGVLTAYAQGFLLLAGVFALALVAACRMGKR